MPLTLVLFSLSSLSGDAHHNLCDRPRPLRPDFCLEVAVRYTQGADHCLVLWTQHATHKDYKAIVFTKLSLRDAIRRAPSPPLFLPSPLSLSCPPYIFPVRTGAVLAAQSRSFTLSWPHLFPRFWKLSHSPRALEPAGLWLNQVNTTCWDN